MNPDRNSTGARAPLQARNVIRFLLKLTLLPFRFIWLLLVWLKLTSAARRPKT